MVMNPSSADLLRGHGIHATAQRLAVLRAVSSHPHATADVVAQMAGVDIGAISRQAVYDNLAVLVEKGLIRRIQPVGSPALYEDRVADNHHHLICRLCRSVVDVDCAVGSTPCLTAADDMGYEIDEAEVAYWGRCSRCQDEGRTATLSDPQADRRQSQRRASSAPRRAATPIHQEQTSHLTKRLKPKERT
jgi:Fur family transcriptional regulator, stress-responsive regulator